MLKTKIVSLALVGLMTIGGTGITAFAAETSDAELTLGEIISVQDENLQSEQTQVEVDDQREQKLSGFTGTAISNGTFKALATEEREELKAEMIAAREVVKAEKKVEITEALAELQARKDAMLDEKMSEFEAAKDASETPRETLTEEKKAELEANKAVLEAEKESMKDDKKAELESNKAALEAEKQAKLNEKKTVEN